MSTWTGSFAAPPGPFQIQAITLPDALAGRQVLGRGRAGSGKTLLAGGELRPAGDQP